MSGPSESKSSTQNTTKNQTTNTTTTTDSNNTSINYTDTTTYSGVQSGDLATIISGIENDATTAIDSVAAANAGQAVSPVVQYSSGSSGFSLSNLTSGEKLAIAGAMVGLLIFLRSK